MQPGVVARQVLQLVHPRPPAHPAQHLVVLEHHRRVQRVPRPIGDPVALVLGRQPVGVLGGPAVRDGLVITASGMGGVEFAYEIIGLLDLYGQADRQLWLTIFRDKAVPEGVG